MSSTVFESAPKPVGETRRIVADFLGRMTAGSTISSGAVSQAVYSGATSTLSLSAAVVTGTTVYVDVAAGTAGVIYQLTFLATTSDSQVLSMRTLLAVAPDAL